eukprot:CAMPEP_0184706220 /NCGR_PEP_ID=MMETSP0313-20130426/36648_1 /TAXON_ID=2792 /ORGANISM="Porphyridium aerugineum, Strain SAG 1380-2" /LENGTH=298 /DNA_ID=CAMNT_0027167769 /DNA_START=68 /DNA_END=964 /DNA_ORIENTATION=+
MSAVDKKPSRPGQARRPNVPESLSQENNDDDYALDKDNSLEMKEGFMPLPSMDGFLQRRFDDAGPEARTLDAKRFTGLSAELEDLKMEAMKARSPRTSHVDDPSPTTKGRIRGESGSTLDVRSPRQSYTEPPSPSAKSGTRGDSSSAWDSQPQQPQQPQQQQQQLATSPRSPKSNQERTPENHNPRQSRRLNLSTLNIQTATTPSHQDTSLVTMEANPVLSPSPVTPSGFGSQEKESKPPLPQQADSMSPTPTSPRRVTIMDRILHTGPTSPRKVSLLSSKSNSRSKRSNTNPTEEEE